MTDCCAYHVQMILPGFLLIIEPFSFVPGVINCNKEDMTIITGLIKEGDHKSSDVILSVWESDKVDRRGAK